MTEDLISMMSAVDDGTRTNVPPELLQESLHFLTLGLFKWLCRARSLASPCLFLGAGRKILARRNMTAGIAVDFRVVFALATRLLDRGHRVL